MHVSITAAERTLLLNILDSAAVRADDEAATAERYATNATSMEMADLEDAIAREHRARAQTARAILRKLEKDGGN
jgi:hypothetical protein